MSLLTLAPGETSVQKIVTIVRQLVKYVQGLPLGTVTSIATAGLATGGPITATGTVTVTAAVKADQTTGTSTTAAVVPNVQQFHASAAKAWGYVTVSGTTYTVQASYGITSVTRTALGTLTVVWSTAFTSVNYSVHISPATIGTVIGTSTIVDASTIHIDIRNPNTTANVDNAFSLVAFGTQ